MKLINIVRDIQSESKFNKEREVSSIVFDSREVIKDSIFVAINGTESDGHTYISKAIENGATTIIYENDAFIKNDNLDIDYIKVENSRKSLSIMASAFYKYPSKKINLVGVTGTNGKTTIATLLYNLFTDLGYSCGLISTIENYVGTKKYPTEHTTPNPVSLNKLFNEMVENGCEYCFMEVSSHSLSQDRVGGLEFKGAIFTNITHDHLDYHKTFAEYIRCKKLLFDKLAKESFAITNIDDKNGNIMVQNTNASIYRYSMKSDADFNVRILEKSIDGSLLKIDGQEVWSRFIGTHNAHNLIAVYGTAILLGMNKMEVLTKISNLKSVSGRLEYIKGGENITAVVDYAHTPDALENVLKTLNDISGNDIITVFGCGGNRDKTKRPEMAEIAEKYSNRIFITSDNPRFENPEEIIEDIKKGLSKEGERKAICITDRSQAIKTAIMTAKKDSIILIAGKGHEDYQIINGVKHHLDDKEIIKESFNLIK